MKTRNQIYLAIALFLIFSSVIFVWTNELVMDYNGNRLTNGFRIWNGLQSYHVYMYLLFFFVLSASSSIILLVVDDEKNS